MLEIRSKEEEGEREGGGGVKERVEEVLDNAGRK